MVVRTLLRTCIAALSMVMAPTVTVAQDSTLIDFEIKDQFHRVHRDTDYAAEDIVVIIGSDKDGSKFNEGWGKAIWDSLEAEAGDQTVVFLPVADVRGVPFFLKGIVRGKFPKKKDQWVLLDWKGRFAKAYDFEPKSTNILVFTPSRELLHRTHGQEVDLEILDAVLRALRGLLKTSKAQR